MRMENQTPAKTTQEAQEIAGPDRNEALSGGEEMFHEIFDKVNDAIQIHEIQQDGLPGRFVEVNEVACRMLQYTREELLRIGPL